MTQVSAKHLRNVALVAHGGAGKTQLAEALLFTAGAIDRFGKVDAGTTTMDFDPEEVARKMSITTAIAPCRWRDRKINLFDTPGYFDFVGEVKAALRVADAALVVCDAQAGVEVGTEMVWRYADEYDLPRLAFINKMDRDNADFHKTLAQLQAVFGAKVAAAQLPIGSGDQFAGIVDLVTGTALVAADGQMYRQPVPDHLAAQVAELQEVLMERVAESDDELLERYLEEGSLTAADLVQGMRQAVVTGHIVPVLCGAGLHCAGAQPLLDAIIDWLPGPGAGRPTTATGAGGSEVTLSGADDGQPFSALIFKTVADPYVGKISLFKVYAGVITADSSLYNVSRRQSERLGGLFVPAGREQHPVQSAAAGDIVGAAKLQHSTTGDSLGAGQTGLLLPPIKFPRPVYSVAVEPRSKADEDKIGSSLTRLAEEDPTFFVERNAETKQALLYGMGELHLDIVTGRLRRKFGVAVDLSRPKVPYLETITQATQAEYRHKKQSGGRGQYGHVLIRLEPLGRGEGFQFDEEIFGGAVPRQYIPGVEKGVREALADGVLAGYPVTDVRVVLYDGSFHSVDSSEMAFKLAASQAFKKGCRLAAPVLLEPIADVAVYAPEYCMGDLMGDLNKRRGRIIGMETHGADQIVRARVPVVEMFTYAADLRSMTQGRGTYTMSTSHYEEVPEAAARQVVAGHDTGSG